MEFLADYGSFLLKAVTVVVAIIVIAGALVSLGSRHKRRNEGELVVKKINDELEDFKQDLEIALYSEAELKQLDKDRKKEEERKRKSG